MSDGRRVLPEPLPPASLASEFVEFASHARQILDLGDPDLAVIPSSPMSQNTGQKRSRRLPTVAKEVVIRRAPRLDKIRDRITLGCKTELAHRGAWNRADFPRLCVPPLRALAKGIPLPDERVGRVGVSLCADERQIRNFWFIENNGGPGLVTYDLRSHEIFPGDDARGLGEC